MYDLTYEKSLHKIIAAQRKEIKRLRSIAKDLRLLAFGDDATWGLVDMDSSPFVRNTVLEKAYKVQKDKKYVI